MNELLENIWRQHHDQLLAFISKRIKNRDDAEDILQEVFIKILSNIEKLKDSSKLQSWIFQITRNAIVDYIRKKKFQELEAEISDIEEETDKTAMNEATGWIGFYVDSLPENYRDAVVLYEIKGKSQKEIAEQLGISYVNARSRIQRGRQLLKKTSPIAVPSMWMCMGTLSTTGPTQKIGPIAETPKIVLHQKLRGCVNKVSISKFLVLWNKKNKSEMQCANITV